MHIKSPADWLNLPKALCQACLGHNHSHGHRMLAGLVVMAVGVAIAKAGAEYNAFAVHYVTDAVGFAVHGLGAVPFLEWLLEESA